ncbi:MAG: DUF4860 domain-containing protein [Coprococcus sp.]
MVLILSAHVYSTQTVRATENYQTSTPLAYLTEKVRQNDVADSISIEELSGISCLALRGSSDDISYTTYAVYVRWLAERAFGPGWHESLTGNRKKIIEASDFSIEELSNGLYRLTITDTSGEIHTRILSERSRL